MTNRAFVLRARTLVATAAILAAGLLPYAFIVIRSRQPGAYLESQATSVAELPDVMLARQFSDRVFAFDWRQCRDGAAAAIVTGVMVTELTLRRAGAGRRRRRVSAAATASRCSVCC